MMRFATSDGRRSAVLRVLFPIAGCATPFRSSSFALAPTFSL